MPFENPFNNFIFDVIPFIVFIVFALVIMVFMTVFIKGISEYLNNNRMSQKSEPARIISKRTHIWGGRGNMSAHTSYYITFELENGERLESPINGQIFGLNTEGDTGILTHQGTRFINFEREMI